MCDRLVNIVMCRMFCLLNSRGLKLLLFGVIRLLVCSIILVVMKVFMNRLIGS